MPVQIHGREYKTVAERIIEFRAAHKHEFGINTELLSNAEEIVVRAVITDSNGMIIATGHAAEIRGSTNINKTSALENCETSAIGRCLAALGFAGTEYASADELSDALIKQKELECWKQQSAHVSAVRDLWDSISVIRQGIADNNLESAHEAWNELTDDEKRVLWVAPSKGGIFTTHEREVMKSNEWSALNKADAA